MEVFRSFTGQSAKLAFCFEVMCRIFCNKNCDDILVEGKKGGVFQSEVFENIENEAKRLNGMNNSEEKDKEIGKFHKKLLNISCP